MEKFAFSPGHYHVVVGLSEQLSPATLHLVPSLSRDQIEAASISEIFSYGFHLMAHKLVSKAEAKKLGQTTYYTGKLCSKGHDAPRYTNSDKCIECHKERNARRQRGKATSGKAKRTAPITPAGWESKFDGDRLIVKPIIGDWRFYVTEIAAAWQKAVGSIIETGKLLNEAKANVNHGDWGKLLRELPFRERTAQMLMAIAANPVLADTNHGSDLPPSWRTLYELHANPLPLISRASNLQQGVHTPSGHPQWPKRTDCYIVVTAGKGETMIHSHILFPAR